MLSKYPDVIISTPAKILTQLQSGNISLKNSLETLVIDEADLVFSFGFENDLKGIVDHLPSIYQVGFSNLLECIVTNIRLVTF